MALPSAVMLGSLAFVVAAGVGLVAVASSAAEDTGKEPSADQPKTPPEAPPTTAPTKKPQHKPPAKPRDTVPKVLVEVYNNSGISGLAADRAAVLHSAGWNVAATDNWYGNIPANTVYFPDRMQRQARELADVLDITRLRPAVSPMQFDRLTVIFTSG